MKVADGVIGFNRIRFEKYDVGFLWKMEITVNHDMLNSLWYFYADSFIALFLYRHT